MTLEQILLRRVAQRNPFTRDAIRALKSFPELQREPSRKKLGRRSLTVYRCQAGGCPVAVIVPKHSPRPKVALGPDEGVDSFKLEANLGRTTTILVRYQSSLACLEPGVVSSHNLRVRLSGEDGGNRALMASLEPDGTPMSSRDAFVPASMGILVGCSAKKADGLILGYVQGTRAI